MRSPLSFVDRVAESIQPKKAAKFSWGGKVKSIAWTGWCSCRKGPGREGRSAERLARAAVREWRRPRGRGDDGGDSDRGPPNQGGIGTEEIRKTPVKIPPYKKYGYCGPDNHPEEFVVKEGEWVGSRREGAGSPITPTPA